MNTVLLSGGSGKRLWPLSNEANSKQFLTLLKDERGESESMVQRVYRQLKRVAPDANVLVATNTSQVDTLHRQLGDRIDISVEPSRRNTYPAIALSAAYLRYQKQLEENEVMIVLPIDVCADAGYFEKLREMEEKLQQKDSNIVLMGVKPTYPSEKYGYILVEKNTVRGFKEKPDAEEAERLLHSGALWNCGVFAVRIGYILDKVRKTIGFESYEDLREQYDKLPVNSFDYEIVEHEPSIGVVEYDGKWKDLGTWNTLTEEMENHVIGKDVILSEDSKDTHILNMLDIPVVALGVPDAVIVASHDGILVSDKHQSSYLKPHADKIKLRTMYERRKWGDYRVLDYVKAEEGSTLVKRMHVKAGKSISYQYHNKRSETWVIVSGEGIVTIDGEKQVVEPGSVVTIPIGTKHKLAAASDLEFVEVQFGEGELEEEDIVRE